MAMTHRGWVFTGCGAGLPVDVYNRIAHDFGYGHHAIPDPCACPQEEKPERPPAREKTPFELEGLAFAAMQHSRRR